MIQGLRAEELPAVPPPTVEPGIRTLVDHLYTSTWCRPRQSCEGHPERQEGPWVWIAVHPSALFCLWVWMDRANALLPEWLISASYLGRAEGCLWFEVRGRYLRPSLNQRIIDVLLETL